VRIERFDPRTDEPSLRACFDITDAGWPADHPNSPPWPFTSFAGKWVDGFDSSPQQAWLGCDENGHPVGCYLLRLPAKQNLTRADCHVAVDPRRRRTGIGSALIAHCAEQARRAGRTCLAAADVRDDSAGAAFAHALGGRPGIADVRRTLTIDADVTGRLPALRAEAERHAFGFSLLSWRGGTPDQHLDQVVRLANAMADAPRDAGVEPSAWDASRLQHLERTLAEHGLRGRSVAARHDGTGTLAAITRLCTDDGTPGWAFQQKTVVAPEHRGHRLGLLVKAAMLEWLIRDSPEVGRIYTGNAGVNEHMIAINERLGFEVGDVYRFWEFDLPDVAPQS
jgi:GNAT superfamily N-acetyltransferase